jgi:hypothetical protein
MSKSKSAIQEIKNLMVSFGFMNEEVTLQSFKLEDETILQAAKLEAGNKIFKINEAFEQVALENGSYKLKDNFEIEVSEGSISAVKEIFLDAKLKDGTKIKVSGDSVIAGAKVVVVKEDGEEVPAPDAVHELEDGSKVETVGGVISKVEEAEDKAEEKEADIEAEDGLDPEKSMKDIPHSMGDKPYGMEGEVMELLKEFVSKMGEKISKMEEDMSALSNDFNSFRKQPAAKKIADGKVENFTKQDNDVDLLAARIATLKTLK